MIVNLKSMILRDDSYHGYCLLNLDKNYQSKEEKFKNISDLSFKRSKYAVILLALFCHHVWVCRGHNHKGQTKD